jgi:hydrogenase expression/formation protein HypE
MADFSKTGVVIDKRLVPFTGATKAICGALGLDPFRLISSGSLMIASPYPEQVMAELDKQGVSSTVIGKFTNISEGLFYIENDGSYVKLSPPGADEIYSI